MKAPKPANNTFELIKEIIVLKVRINNLEAEKEKLKQFLNNIRNEF